MSYEYTDGGGYMLHVHPHLPGPAMEIATPRGTVRVSPDEAPALALAILTTAGYGNRFYQAGEMRDLPDVAHDALTRHKKHRAEAEAREQEDARVREFRTHSLAAVQDEFGNDDWDGLTDIGREGWRKRYRAAQEFFTRDEKPAPRALNYGDPEPDRDTRWLSSSREVWAYRGDGWRHRYYGDVWGRRPFNWSELDRADFPMTEVTE